jgi:hypothetical protein
MHIAAVLVVDHAVQKDVATAAEDLQKLVEARRTTVQWRCRPRLKRSSLTVTRAVSIRCATGAGTITMPNM